MIDVLILDDDEAFLCMLGDFLPAEGYQLRSFTRVEPALASLYINPPQVVILDLMLPVTDGFSFYRQLRANPATATLPVVLSTAAPKHITNSEQFAGDQHMCLLAKPYSLAELATRLQELALVDNS